MTDGERIKRWLEDYKFYQERRLTYERRMVQLMSDNILDMKVYEYLKEKIEDCENRMRSLRERVMIYGDY